MSGFLHLSDFHLVEDETTLTRAFNAKYILKSTVDKILGRKSGDEFYAEVKDHEIPHYQYFFETQKSELDNGEPCR